MEEWRAGRHGRKDATIGSEPQARKGGVHVGFFNLRQDGVELVEQLRQRALRSALPGVEQRGAGGGFEHAHEDASR